MKLAWNKQKWHWTILISCFIYGGVSLVIFSLEAGPLVRSSLGSSEGPQEPIQNGSNMAQYRQFLERQFTGFGRGGPGRGRIATLHIPVLAALFLGSLISILAGISLLDLLKKRERKELTRNVIDSMLTPDEKLVVAELERSGGEMTQSVLVLRTGLSKVKIHRIIKKLEQLGVVTKYQYGVTNNIRLEKGLIKEAS